MEVATQLMERVYVELDSLVYFVTKVYFINIFIFCQIIIFLFYYNTVKMILIIINNSLRVYKELLHYF